jgi:sugar lactone lactonase YvrE
MRVLALRPLAQWTITELALVSITSVLGVAALSGCSKSPTAPPAPPTGSIALWVAGAQGLLGYTTSQLASGTSAGPAVVVTPFDYASGPSGLTFDASGNLWVSGLGVFEYTTSQLSAGRNPTPQVSLSALVLGSDIDPGALAFDASGNLWVATNDGIFDGVVEFTASQIAAGGSPVPPVTLAVDGSSSPAQPCGLAFDHSGNLWVSNYSTQPSSQPSTVVEFTTSQLAAGGNPIPVPAVTLSDDGSGSLTQPCGLAFDSSGNLWVANAANIGAVVEFASSQLRSTGSPTPAVKLTNGGVLASPAELAFDGHGNLWVSYLGAGLSTGAVFEFAPSQLMASGTPTPTVTISGPSITGSLGLAFVR